MNLDHWTEGFMPKGEQIMGQTHRPGERIRCLILDVKDCRPVKSSSAGRIRTSSGGCSV